MDLSVKANKNQGDYREVFIQAAHSCCYRPVFICSSGNKLIVLFSPAEGFAPLLRQLFWLLYSTASTERDIQGLRAAQSQKSPGGQESSAICHECACQSASWDGCWINSNVPRIPVMGIFALCKERMS